MAKDILDAYGCLIAGAIGDALGAPVEGWYYTQIREKYEKVKEFMPFHTGYSNGAPDSVTDDSILRHYLCLAIVENDGKTGWQKTWAYMPTLMERSSNYWHWSMILAR